MAFENVDVTSLRQALNSCKNSINYRTSKTIINNISNPAVWQSDQQPVLKEAMEKLINIRYRNLEDKLEDYQIITNYIEDYQKLSKQNQIYTTECNNLRKEMNDDNRNTIQNKISSNKNKIESNETKMEIIIEKIKKLI